MRGRTKVVGLERYEEPSTVKKGEKVVVALRGSSVEALASGVTSE